MKSINNLPSQFILKFLLLIYRFVIVAMVIRLPYPKICPFIKRRKGAEFVSPLVPLISARKHCL